MQREQSRRKTLKSAAIELTIAASNTFLSEFTPCAGARSFWAGKAANKDASVEKKTEEDNWSWRDVMDANAQTLLLTEVRLGTLNWLAPVRYLLSGFLTSSVMVRKKGRVAASLRDLYSHWDPHLCADCPWIHDHTRLLLPRPGHTQLPVRKGAPQPSLPWRARPQTIPLWYVLRGQVMA